MNITPHLETVSDFLEGVPGGQGLDQDFFLGPQAESETTEVLRVTQVSSSL